MSLFVNGLTVNTMRFLAGWTGVWVAELDIAADVQPTGRVAIVGSEGIALSGTVDDKRSGTFGEKRQIRVIGGGAGWGERVRAQHYHSDVGLPLAAVVSTTAAEAKEIATVLVPTLLGKDFVRRRGPAGQIFTDAGVDWWVGLDGVTRVGLRIPTPPPLSLQVLDWNPSHGTVSFTCDTLVEPGAILIDIRFGRRIVRQVEAIVSGGSVTGTLWVGEEQPDAGTLDELAGELAALANEATRSTFSRFFEYRVIAMAGDRVELQAVNPVTDGVPDILPASIWAGASGYKATLAPASRVLVGFRAGDQKQPYVAFYEAPEGDGWRPLALELDALFSLTIGKQALGVVIGNVATAQPIARAPAIAAFATALATAISAQAAAATATAAVPVVGTSLGGFLAALAAAVTTAAGTLATACPSTKAMSS